MTRAADNATDLTGGWGRGRMLLILAAALAVVVLLACGLGYAVRRAVATDAPIASAADAEANAPVGPGAREAAEGVRGSAYRDRLADAPMSPVEVGEEKPAAPAAVPAPAMTIPSATSAGPGGVPSGFPRTPEGAVGQLAAIETTVLDAMTIATVNTVHAAWVVPGVDVSDWELTHDVQAFLAGAGMGAAKDPGTTVQVTPGGAMVKGVDGPDWVLACVLLRVAATIVTTAATGYGYCAPMVWQADRWIIGGGEAAKAPSTWPGSDAAVRVGWRTWATHGEQS